uniref:Transmembrane protein n=1 Tax=Halimeda micronesica TaxID=170426 RepID=A0A386AXG4_9CHLO|nr:hypothetical protein [Halimeda micronesica]
MQSEKKLCQIFLNIFTLRFDFVKCKIFFVIIQLLKILLVLLHLLFLSFLTPQNTKSKLTFFFYLIVLPHTLQLLLIIHIHIHPLLFGAATASKANIYLSYFNF